VHGEMMDGAKKKNTKCLELKIIGIKVPLNI
jgi:hypothetical protein